MSESRSVVSDSLRPCGLYSPWNSPGQNTGVGSLSLLQGIFPTQGSNPGLPHCRRILYQLSYREALARPHITCASLPFTILLPLHSHLVPPHLPFTSPSVPATQASVPLLKGARQDPVSGLRFHSPLSGAQITTCSLPHFSPFI